MRIGPFGIWELLVIAVLVLLLFGPNKLPEMARGLTQALKEFRRGMNEVSRDLREELNEAASAQKTAEVRPATEQRPVTPAEHIQPRGAVPATEVPQVAADESAETYTDRRTD